MKVSNTSILQFTTEIHSQTITVPELSQFVGKTVQITVQSVEEKPRMSWSEIRAWADQLDLDFDAISQYREFERKQSPELL